MDEESTGYYRLWLRVCAVIFIVAGLAVQFLPSLDQARWQERVAERGPTTWTLASVPFDEHTVPALDLGLSLTRRGAERQWARLTASHEDLRTLRPAITETRLWGILTLTRLMAVGQGAPELEAQCGGLAASGRSCANSAVQTSAIVGFLEPGEIVLQDERPEAFAVLKEALAEGAQSDETFGDVNSLQAQGTRTATLALRPREGDIIPLVEPPLMWVEETVTPADPSLVTVSAVGDIMMGTDHPSSSWLNPDIYDGVPVDQVLEPGLVDIFRRSDVAFANLEGVLFDGKAPAKDCKNCFAFKSPEYYAEVLADAGITAVSLANNHSGDFGRAGRKATVGALGRAGIAYAGLDMDGARTATITTKAGVKIGLVAFSPNIGTLSIHDYSRASALVSDLEASHDITIVSFHGGAEGVRFTRVPAQAEIYFGEDRGNVRRFARAMVRAGADMVLGHGPHVPRAMELYQRKLIAYSLGNFWTYAGMKSWGVLGLGPLLEVKLTPEGVIAGLRVHATRQAGQGIPRLDPFGEARSLVLHLTKLDFPKTHDVLTGKKRLLVSLRREGHWGDGADDWKYRQALPTSAQKAK